MCERCVGVRSARADACLQLFALKQVERIAGIKFQPISPPQPEDILKAAAKDVIKYARL